MIESARGAPVRELVVISGKGGTGKTSIVASFAMLAKSAVLADCDVDAADLYLLLSPEVEQSEQFFSGRVAVIRENLCIACGECLEHCRFDAVRTNGKCDGEALFCVDPIVCEGCGVCVRFCPEQAIEFPERHCGEWFVSDTRSGPMVHARLGAAAGNSGKLVSFVRTEARRVAARDHKSLIVIDGPPGVGCPVIASVTGTSLALVITEPTVSGEHDLDRVLRLTEHFRVPTAICVNKWDVNPSMAERIERKANEMGAAVAGRVRYDDAVTSAQLNAKAAVEVGGGAAGDIRALWQGVQDIGSTHGLKF
jgi:MinD superfamily P-loop ATPase